VKHPRPTTAPNDRRDRNIHTPLRLVDRCLQAPTVSYAHPDTGRSVTVVGTLHVGEQAYFNGLRGVIDGLSAAGMLVHSEGSRLLPCDEPDITDAEQQLLSDLRRCHELEQRRVAGLGWVGQVAGLGYPPHWQITDLNQLQIIRRCGPDTIGRTVARMRKSLDWPDSDPRGVARFRFATAVSLHALARSPKPARRDTDAVLLHARTALALDRLDATNRDTVMVWGSGHVPGLDAGLRQRGFLATAEPQWHTAVELPSRRRALRDLILGTTREVPDAKR
jgi:hypothetical protein